MSSIKSMSWSIIIEKIDNETNEVLLEEKLINFCNRVFVDYYGILHDKDINNVGELKRPHYHIIGIFEKTFGKSRVLKILSVLLGIKENRITLTTTISATYELRYLLHLDNREKYQYSVDSVFALDKEKYIYTISRKMTLNADCLMNIAKSVKNKFQYLKLIGFDYYERHFKICDLIRNERLNNNDPITDI